MPFTVATPGERYVIAFLVITVAVPICAYILYARIQVSRRTAIMGTSLAAALYVGMLAVLWSSLMDGIPTQERILAVVVLGWWAALSLICSQPPRPNKEDGA